MAIRPINQYVAKPKSMKTAYVKTVITKLLNFQLLVEDEELRSNDLLSEER